MKMKATQELTAEHHLSAIDGLLRLAIPPAWVLVGQIIDDAYAVEGKRSLLKKMWGSVLGWGLAYLSQLAFSAGNGSLSLPARVMFFGSAAGLLLSIALKFMFPSATDRPVGVDKPAHWLKHTAEPFRAERELIIIARALLFVLVLAFIGGQVGGRLMAVALVLISVLLLILRELRRRWR